MPEPRCKHESRHSLSIERRPYERFSEELMGTYKYTHEWRLHCQECGGLIDNGQTNTPELIASEHQVTREDAR